MCRLMHVHYLWTSRGAGLFHRHTLLQHRLNRHKRRAPRAQLIHGRLKHIQATTKSPLKLATQCLEHLVNVFTTAQVLTVDPADGCLGHISPENKEKTHRQHVADECVFLPTQDLLCLLHLFGQSLVGGDN